MPALALLAKVCHGSNVTRVGAFCELPQFMTRIGEDIAYSGGVEAFVFGHCLRLALPAVEGHARQSRQGNGLGRSTMKL